MYKKKKILVIVLARGGSKGIKNKNLRKINGISLVGLVGKFIKKINFIDLAVVSTDSHKIGNEAKKNNINFIFLRPKKIAGSKIMDEIVLKHGLLETEKKLKTKFDIILSLPPTSPLRKTKDVVLAIKKLVDEKLDAVWTISKIDSKYHPFKALEIKQNKLVFFSSLGKKIKYRQQLSNIYFRNGNCYVFSRKAVINKNILPKKSGYILSRGIQISIDNFDDLAQVRKYLK